MDSFFGGWLDFPVCTTRNFRSSFPSFSLAERISLESRATGKLSYNGFKLILYYFEGIYLLYMVRI